MANLTAGIDVKPVGSGGIDTLQLVVGTVKVYKGGLAAQLTADGTAVAASTALAGDAIGVFQHDAEIGAVVTVETNRVYRYTNGTAGNACSAATPIGASVYCGDDNTIYDNSAGGTLVQAGIFEGLDSDGLVLLRVHPFRVINKTNAVDIAVADTGSFTAQTEVEGALAEIYQDLKSAIARIDLDVMAMTKVDGTALAKYSAANDGTVGVYGDGTKVIGLRWNNTAGATDTVAKTFAVPDDCDLTVAPVIKITSAKVGATIGDATTFVCGLYAQTPAVAFDAGANLGVTTGAMTGDAASKTVQQVNGTCTVFPGLTSRMTLTVNPTAAKLGTDDVIVTAIEVIYKRKLRTS